MTPTLAGAAIVLRPLVVEDAEALFIALGDPEVQRYRRDDAHADVAQTRAYIETSIARGFAWAITTDGSEALGRLALRVNGETGEFGIVLRRTAQRRGLGRKALELAESYAADVLKLRRLQASIDTENAASLALFEGAGFQRERILPRDRGVHDSVILAKVPR